MIYLTTSLWTKDSALLQEWVGRNNLAVHAFTGPKAGSVKGGIKSLREVAK